LVKAFDWQPFYNNQLIYQDAWKGFVKTGATELSSPLVTASAAFSGLFCMQVSDHRVTVKSGATFGCITSEHFLSDLADRWAQCFFNASSRIPCFSWIIIVILEYVYYTNKKIKRVLLQDPCIVRTTVFFMVRAHPACACRVKPNTAAVTVTLVHRMFVLLNCLHDRHQFYGSGSPYLCAYRVKPNTAAVTAFHRMFVLLNCLHDRHQFYGSGSPYLCAYRVKPNTAAVTAFHRMFVLFNCLHDRHQFYKSGSPYLCAYRVKPNIAAVTAFHRMFVLLNCLHDRHQFYGCGSPYLCAYRVKPNTAAVTAFHRMFVPAQLPARQPPHEKLEVKVLFKHIQVSERPSEEKRTKIKTLLFFSQGSNGDANLVQTTCLSSTSFNSHQGTVSGQDCIPPDPHWYFLFLLVEEFYSTKVAPLSY